MTPELLATLTKCIAIVIAIVSARRIAIKVAIFLLVDCMTEC